MKGVSTGLGPEVPRALVVGQMGPSTYQKNKVPLMGSGLVYPRAVGRPATCREGRWDGAGERLGV